MLPVLVVGTVAALGVTGYKLARQCTRCQERFNWTYSCLCCDQVICSKCAKTIEPVSPGGSVLRAGGYACPGSCTTSLQITGDDLVAKYKAEQERIRMRRERISRVRLVSVNFGGQQNPLYGIKLETGWHTEKSDAEEAARTIAVDRHDVDIVWYVNAASRKSECVNDRGRTYFYREWRVVGEV